MKLAKLTRKAFQAAGRVGGLARAAKLSPERRSEIAKAAVTAREEKRRLNRLAQS